MLTVPAQGINTYAPPTAEGIIEVYTASRFYGAARAYPRDFIEQRDAFNSTPLSELINHIGKFVVSRDGKIVDADDDLPTLTNRFFGKHGRVSVYITRIPPKASEQVLTPFFE